MSWDDDKDLPPLPGIRPTPSYYDNERPADFAAWHTAWLATHPRWPDDGWRAYCDEIRAHNECIRSAYRRERACRTAFAARCPRHAQLVLSSTFDATAAVVAMQKWAADPQRSIAVLAGPPGTGKTSAAAWWAWRRADGDPSRLPQWIAASTFARSSRYDDDRDKVLGASALVLDDLGVEYLDAKGSFLVDLDELVDVFYGNERPLVITTNCDAKTFGERYGTRITSRLAEAGTWIPVTGADRRRRT